MADGGATTLAVAAYPPGRPGCPRCRGRGWVLRSGPDCLAVSQCDCYALPFPPKAQPEGGLYRCVRAEVERPSLRPVVALEREGGRGGLALSGPDAAGVALGALYRLRLEEAGPGPDNFTG